MKLIKHYEDKLKIQLLDDKLILHIIFINIKYNILFFIINIDNKNINNVIKSEN